MLSDYYIANRMVYKTISMIKYNQNFKLCNVTTNSDVINFITKLVDKTEHNKKKINDLICSVTNNSIIEQIYILDLIILHMAICEFIYFTNIPTKVTINEYIEITKRFSTKKSKNFVNVILDNVLKNLYQENKIHKFY